MGKASVIDMRLRLLGAKKFEKDADKTAKKTAGIGKAAKNTGKKLVGVAAGFAGIAGAKKAVDTTLDLGKATLSLNKTFGMNVETSSRWAATAKVRNVDNAKLSQGFTKLNRAVGSANDGSQSAIDTFAKLGISQNELGAWDTEELLFGISDGLAGIEDKGQKAALMQQVFGKGSQALAPLLRGGSAALEEQLGLAGKYGATFKSTEDIEEFIKMQRESQLAMMGLQITVGKKVIPALSQFYDKLRQILDQMRAASPRTKAIAIAVVSLAAATGVLAKVFTAIGAVAKGIGALAKVLIKAVKWMKAFSLQALLLKVRLFAVKVAMVATRIATVAMRVAMIAWRAVLIGVTIATKAWAVAMKLANLALRMNPIGLVITGLVLLGVAIVAAYKRFGWFRRGVRAVWNFLKGAWSKVAQVLGAPVRQGVRNAIFAFRLMQAVVKRVVGGARKVLGTLVSAIGGMPSKITGKAKGMFNGIKDAFKNAINWIVKKWNDLEFKIPGVDPPGPGPRIPGFSVGTPNIPMLGDGGFMRRGSTGSFITGERGAELQTVTPRGITVQPLSKGLKQGVAAALGGGGGQQQVVVSKVYLDGRQIAEAVGDTQRKVRARR